MLGHLQTLDDADPGLLDALIARVVSELRIA